jgi:hypothetical protein
MLEYKESELYKTGMAYQEWGRLLCKADTTLREISDFAFVRGVKPEFSLWKTVKVNTPDPITLDCTPEEPKP